MSSVQGVVLTFSGADWVGSNHARVFIGGGGDIGWTTFDDGTFGNPSRQQWQWMDVSSVLGGIPGGDTVVSATLSFPGVARQASFGGDSSSVTYSIFEVPGADQGRAAVIAAGGAGRDGNDARDFYAENTGFGAVTGIGETASSESFDVTALVEGWNNGSLTTNPGQMMLLWDSQPSAANYVRWGNPTSDNTDLAANESNRPTLTITTVPEPSGAFLFGLASLTMMMRRRR